MAVVVAGTVTAVALTAVATPAPSPQPTPPVVTTAAPVSAEPDSAQTRYVDRLCASGSSSRSSPRRGAFTAGRKTMAAAQPLTVDAHRTGVNSYLDGTRSLALAATVVKDITLPPDYTADSASAPHCKD